MFIIVPSAPLLEGSPEKGDEEVSKRGYIFRSLK